jgi:hypothetical protein
MVVGTSPLLDLATRWFVLFFAVSNRILGVAADQDFAVGCGRWRTCKAEDAEPRNGDGTMAPL